MFGEPNFVGQYTIPVSCVRKGFRSVNLKNGFSEELELSGKINFYYIGLTKTSTNIYC